MGFRVRWSGSSRVHSAQRSADDSRMAPMALLRSGQRLQIVRLSVVPQVIAGTLEYWLLVSCWSVSEPTIQHEPRDWSRRACRDAFELFDNGLAARLHSGNAVQHLDEIARPIRFVSNALGKQVDVA